MDAETSEIRLVASLRAHKETSQGLVQTLQEQAQQIAAATKQRYDKEMIQGEMAYARNLGVTTDRLGEAVEAAVGLARAYDKDLRTATKIASLAVMGDADKIRQLGIVTDETASKTDLAAEVLRRSAIGYEQARDEAHGLSAELKQLGQNMEDLAQAAGKKPVGWLGKLLGVANWEVDVFRESYSRGLDTMYNNLSPAQQGSFQTAYQQRTGKEFKVWGRLRGQQEFDYTNAVDPRDREYARRLLESYTKSAQQQTAIQEAIQKQRTESGKSWAGPSFEEEILGFHLGTDLGPDAYLTALDWDKRKGEAEKYTDHVTNALRRMYNDMDRNAQESWVGRQQLLDEERSEYRKLTLDQNLIDKWYDQQWRELEIGRLESSQDVFAGWQAGTMRMQDELQTMGELGAESARTFKEGMADATTDALLRVRTLGEGVRALGLEMARIGIHWGASQFFQMGMNAFGGWMGSWGQGGMGPSAFPGESGGSYYTPRAGGGDVARGGSYWVGERGPEPFLPQQAGTILPAGSSGGQLQTMIALLQQIAAGGGGGVAVLDDATLESWANRRSGQRAIIRVVRRQS